MRLLKGPNGSGLRSRTLALVAVSVIASIGLAGGVAWAATQLDEQNEEFTLVARFASASPLLIGNDVKVSGVPVGKVTTMAVRGGKADVTLTIDRSALPVYSDARAVIRPVSLLGERYVDLERGTAGGKILPSGATLSVQQTDTATDLDQILNTIDEPTGKALSALVTMLGQGLKGNGVNTNETIKALAPVMNDTGKLVDVLNRQNAVLNSLVDSTAPVAHALAADQGRSLDRLIASAHRLLGKTSENQAAFQRALVELPGTLAQANESLADITGTTNAMTPMLRGMRPTTDNLAAISQELKRFSDSATPALASAEPVLQRGNQLLEQARSVAAGLRTVGPDLRVVARGQKPLVNDLTDHMGGFWGFIEGWALATNHYDGISHFFRAEVTVDTDEFEYLAPSDGGSRKNGLIDRQPAKVVPPLPLLGKTGGLLTPGAPREDGGVTGLNQKQERNALGFLLGGR